MSPGEIAFAASLLLTEAVSVILGAWAYVAVAGLLYWLAIHRKTHQSLARRHWGLRYGISVVSAAVLTGAVMVICRLMVSIKDKTFHLPTIYLPRLPNISIDPRVLQAAASILTGAALWWWWGRMHPEDSVDRAAKHLSGKVHRLILEDRLTVQDKVAAQTTRSIRGAFRVKPARKMELSDPQAIRGALRNLPTSYAYIKFADNDHRPLAIKIRDTLSAAGWDTTLEEFPDSPKNFFQGIAVTGEIEPAAAICSALLEGGLTETRAFPGSAPGQASVQIYIGY